MGQLGGYGAAPGTDRTIRKKRGAGAMDAERGRSGADQPTCLRKGPYGTSTKVVMRGMPEPESETIWPPETVAVPPDCQVWDTLSTT